MTRFWTERPLIAARHTRCGRLVAVYLWAGDDGDAWEKRAGCECDPTPPLPEGDQLARLIARAAALPTDPTRAALTVRVPLV